MQYVKYGNSGLEVSRVCLGAMTYPSRMEEQEAIDLTRRCLDRGCNFIDTADSYKESEAFLGKALQGVRDQVVLATKVWASKYNDRHRPANGSRHHVLNAVESSLRKLQTDYIDIYMCHHPDPLTPFEETYSTLDGLVKQGKIRYVAMCNAYAWQVSYCLGVCAQHGWEPPVSVQVSYNLIDRVMETETLPMARRFNLMLQGWGAQGGGLLTGKYRRGEALPEDSRAAKAPKFAERLTDGVYGLLDEMRPMAEKYGITMGQLAVCWVLAQSPLVVPVIGGSRAEHIEPLLECPEVEIAAEDMARLTELSAHFQYQPWVNQPQSAAPAVGHNWV